MFLFPIFGKIQVHSELVRKSYLSPNLQKLLMKSLLTWYDDICKDDSLSEKDEITPNKVIITVIAYVCKDDCLSEKDESTPNEVIITVIDDVCKDDSLSEKMKLHQTK